MATEPKEDEKTPVEIQEKPDLVDKLISGKITKLEKDKKDLETRYAEKEKELQDLNVKFLDYEKLLKEINSNPKAKDFIAELKDWFKIDIEKL